MAAVCWVEFPIYCGEKHAVWSIRKGGCLENTRVRIDREFRVLIRKVAKSIGNCCAARREIWPNSFCSFR